MLTSLFVALSLVVPYLTQTDVLCGGAAAAMVFRYWGDAHADPREFVSVVDKRAGGIATDALVRAVNERGWPAVVSTGSIERLERETENHRPLVILVADRGVRYHYLVVTGVEGGDVIVHDPSRGPSRRIGIAALLKMWKATDFWTLLILPGEGFRPPKDGRYGGAEGYGRKEGYRHAEGGRYDDHTNTTSVLAEPTECDRSLADAIGDIQRRGLGDAEAILGRVQLECPGAPGPLRELAGVRFAQRRWADAAGLAEDALARDDTDVYAWDLLGSSRFMQDDLAGALRAWNRIDKPRIDLVQISGIEHTRFQKVADVLGLSPNALLTEQTFRMAERRLRDLPDGEASRLTFRPAADGYARLDVALVERSRPPVDRREWLTLGAHAAVDRELRVAIPGASGEGEVWSASWRWRTDRPAVAFSFATPRPRALPGIWRVETGWDRETYEFGTRRPAASIARESRAHAALSLADWLTPNVRYVVASGLDAWRRDGRTQHSPFFRASLERRWSDDRWVIGTNVTTFGAIGVDARFRSSRSALGWVYVVDAGAARVSDTAPLALWPGGGEGRARSTLVRAHPLLDGGTLHITDSSVFGRTLAYGNAEGVRWMPSASPLHIGIAGFADMATATRRQASARPRAAQVDVGAGIRIKMPGSDSVLRIDVAHGLSDGRDALTFGWVF